MKASSATKAAMRSHVSRRFRRCSSKMLPAAREADAPTGPPEEAAASATIASPRAEVDSRELPVPRVNLEVLCRPEAERARHQVGGEHLLAGLVACDQVVVELAREPDPVLGGDQLLLQCEDILVG